MPSSSCGSAVTGSIPRRSLFHITESAAARSIEPIEPRKGKEKVEEKVRHVRARIHLLLEVLSYSLRLVFTICHNSLAPVSNLFSSTFPQLFPQFISGPNELWEKLREGRGNRHALQLVCILL